MASVELAVTAWNNGKHHASGAGYGLRVSIADRDKHMKREWGSIDLYLPVPDGLAKVNIDKPSFWTDSCRELIHHQIGAWLIHQRKGHWPKGSPPKIKLVQRGERAFDVRPAWNSP